MKFSKVTLTRSVEFPEAPVLTGFSLRVECGATLTATDHGVLVEHEKLTEPVLILWHLVEKCSVLDDSTEALEPVRRGPGRPPKVLSQ